MIKEDYVEWKPEPLVDPRAAKVEQIIHGMEQIIAAEGPVMASRVFPDFLQGPAAWAGSTTDTKRSFHRALETALKNETFLAEKEGSEEPRRLDPSAPEQNRVRIRTWAAAPCTKFGRRTGRIHA